MTSTTTPALERKRFFKPRIQNRLLLAFITVALVPMTVALFAVVKINEAMLEREIYTKLETANLEAGALIATIQDEALQVARELTDRPALHGLYVRKAPTTFDPPIGLDSRRLVGLWLPDPAPGLAPAPDQARLPSEGVRTLMIARLNNNDRLLAGAVVPVYRDGTRIGQLAVGHPLGKSFAQDVEIQTGVVARIFHEHKAQQSLRLLFEADVVTLTEAARAQVQQVAQLLREHSEAAVIVEGHTDDTGDERHNYHLAQRRVGHVTSALVSAGVRRWRISSLNYGETRPITRNDTREGRALNRRVEIRFASEDEEVADIADLPIGADIQELLFTKQQAHYDEQAWLKGEPYRALYHPLVSRNGQVLGMLFLGIPQQYTFSATVGTWRFYPLWIGVGVFLALALGYMVSRTISRPLRRFVIGVREVADGNIDQHLPVMSRDELGELAVAFNTMTHELRASRAREADYRRRDRLAALGEMAAGIAHEIRNPLNIMRNAAQRLLRRTPEGEADQREMSQFIIEEVDRLNRVVSQFLTFARHPLPDPQPTDLNALVQRALGVLAPEADEAAVTVELRLEPELTPALLDPEQGYRVLLNLVQNAFQQMAPQGGGRLTVSTRTISPSVDDATDPGRLVQLEIADTGPGIKADLLDRVFNPFFTTREHGVGLGLSLVHNIVAAHGGEITVTSAPGRGATFVISLPAAPPAGPPPAHDPAESTGVASKSDEVLQPTP